MYLSVGCPQDNPLPWVVGDPRLMNPGIHVGSQLDRLVEGEMTGWLVGPPWCEGTELSHGHCLLRCAVTGVWQLARR